MVRITLIFPIVTHLQEIILFILKFWVSDSKTILVCRLDLAILTLRRLSSIYWEKGGVGVVRESESS